MGLAAASGPHMSETPHTSGFDLRVDHHGSTVILRVSGEFDMVGAERVDACVDELAGNSPEEVVIDLREVTFLDSTGLRSLIRARGKGADAEWSLKLVRGSDRVHRVLTLTRMDDHFDFVEPGDLDE
jgi:anti-anti-sigma factor